MSGRICVSVRVHVMDEAIILIYKLERLILDGQILGVAVKSSKLFRYICYRYFFFVKKHVPPKMIEGKNSLAPPPI